MVSINLFNAKKHDSVIPLIDALEKRQFNGRDLTNAAIQEAFYEGAWRGIKDIVEEFHEHLAITSKEYANGLIESWENNKSKTDFHFYCLRLIKVIWRRLKKMTNIRKIQNFVKPLMMPSQKLNLQELDFAVPREELNLSRRHLVKQQAFNHWHKRKDQETSF